MSGVDKACLDGLDTIVNGKAAVSSPDDWGPMLLVKGEVEVVRVPCVGIKGMPTAPNETVIGQGLLILTKIEEKGAVRHRLHFAMRSDTASMSAEEAWGERTSGCLCCKTKTHSVHFEYESRHGLDMTFAAINVETNLFHAHAKMEDQTTLLATFGGASESQKCCDGCSCCSCCCCLPSCASCCSGGDVSGTWFRKAAYRDSLKAHTEAVTEGAARDARYKFPMIDPVTHAERRTMTSRQLHCVHLVYRNTATNSVQACVALVRPDEPVATLGHFASLLGTLATADPASHERAEAWRLGSLDDDTSFGLGAVFGVASSGAGRRGTCLALPLRLLSLYTAPCRALKARAKS